LENIEKWKTYAENGLYRISGDFDKIIPINHLMADLWHAALVTRS